MKLLRTAMLTVLVGTLACDAAPSPTAPPRALAVAPSPVIAGTTVHLAAYYFQPGDIQAGTRLVVTSYEPYPYPFVWSSITYFGLIHVSHLGDGSTSPNLFTDTVLEPGTMLEALGVPIGLGAFEAMVIGHGSSQ